MAQPFHAVAPDRISNEKRTRVAPADGLDDVHALTDKRGGSRRNSLVLDGVETSRGTGAPPARPWFIRFKVPEGGGYRAFGQADPFRGWRHESDIVTVCGKAETGFVAQARKASAGFRA